MKSGERIAALRMEFAKDVSEKMYRTARIPGCRTFDQLQQGQVPPNAALKASRKQFQHQGSFEKRDMLSQSKISGCEK
ncbi:hypothetical protein [Roseibium album]|uniref:hypothetical protein n=1 Tax=Roseibium album TaxID=311410 RepID=UPI0024916DB1|nr:hypothetical protein [Roseibium album]